VANAAGPQLTARESDVLAAVERRLTNAEIAAELHLSIRTVESHIASLRRKLGADSRSGLIEAARWRRGTAVPVPQNSFVGRDAELDAVRRLLDRERWVTVVGPAGCGKTRLALEVAAASERSPVVVELEHARERDVAGLLAGALGLGSTAPGDVVDACATALDAQSYLLVLDNADRVSDAVTWLVGRVMAVARSVRVLVTSRTPLAARGEAVLQLKPLSIGNDAITLFLDRARTASGGALSFEPTDPAVTRICRQLDGLPLALELAAARTRHLRLDELLVVVDDPERPAREGARHESVDAALAWTWDLLDPSEREVLSCLAVLPWAFDLPLAEAVAGPGSSSVVLRLLERSLVTSAGSVGPGSTFRLLDAVRDFVRRRLEADAVDADGFEADLVERVRRAHAVEIGSRAKRLTAEFDGEDPQPGDRSAHALRPNLLAAIDWACDQDSLLALDLTLSLTVLEDQYSPDTSALETLTRVAQDARVTDVADSSTLDLLARSLFYGDLAIAVPLAAVALERAQTPVHRLAGLNASGFAQAYLYRGQSALVLLREAVQLADELGDVLQSAYAWFGIGMAMRAPDVGDVEGAFAAYDEALRAYAAVGRISDVNNVRYMMANTAATFGVRTEQGVAWAEECVAFARRTANRHELAHALFTRARLVPEQRADHPEDDLTALAEEFRAVGDLRCLARTYLVLAERRPPAEQVRLLEQAFDVGTRAHDPGHQEEALIGLVRRHWAAGDQRRAAFELGRLSGLIGEPAALDRCPDGLRECRIALATSIAEGVAHASSSRAEYPGTLVGKEQ
jgi:predicted ATPase/DNA-binding CsgD family transcriptional regulator